MLEAAISYWRSGLVPCSLVPTTKRPWHTSTKVFDAGPVSESQILEWFARPGFWIGLYCGHTGGDLEGIDFDVPGKAQLPGGRGEPPAWEPWLELVRAHGMEDLLGRLVICSSRSGGKHVLYRCSAVEGSQKLARRPASDQELAAKPGDKIKGLIETRGTGGLIVVEPTPGYEVLQGSLFAVPTITPEERDFLLDAAKHFDAMPQAPEAAPRTPKPRVEGEISPGDDFDDRGSWDDAFGSYPMKRVQRTYQGMQLWVRPGKDPREGWSARTGVGRIGDRFVTWSTSTPFEPGKAYKKYFVYAQLNHGGNVTAAIRELAHQGYGRKASQPAPPEQREFIIVEGDASGDPELIEEGEDVFEFPWDDLGNARRLQFLFGDRLRFCHEWDRFIVWDGTRWQQDVPGNQLARAYAHRVVDVLRERERTKAWAKTSASTGKISAMLTELKALPGIGVRPEDLDADDWLFNCLNGTVNLRTADLLPHDRAHMITKRAAVAYDPSAICPRFGSFLAEIMLGRRELVELLIRALGYSLSGSRREHVFFLLYGRRGRNGKTTLLSVMDSILTNDYSTLIDKRLLRQSMFDDAKFSAAALEGARFAHATETSDSTRLNVEFLKELADGAKMRVERKGIQSYDIRVRACLWYAVNEFPDAKFDPSFRDRMIAIPFEQSFYDSDSPHYRPGDLAPDRDLDRLLHDERAGILALLVQGCLRWQRAGTLGRPEEVTALATEYQTENDHYALWLREACLTSADGRVGQGDAWKAFQEFAKANRLYTGKRKAFKLALLDTAGIRGMNYNGRDMFAGFVVKHLESAPKETLEGMDDDE